MVVSSTPYLSFSIHNRFLPKTIAFSPNVNYTYYYHHPYHCCDMSKGGSYARNQQNATIGHQRNPYQAPSIHYHPGPRTHTRHHTLQPLTPRLSLSSPPCPLRPPSHIPNRAPLAWLLHKSQPLQNLLKPNRQTTSMKQLQDLWTQS